MIKARIVGVIRSPWFSDYGDSARGTARALGRACLAQHRERARRGIGEPATSTRSCGSRAAATPSPPSASSSPRSPADGTSSSSTSPATPATCTTSPASRPTRLLVFAAAAGIAALFLVGQSIVRYVAGSTAELERAAVRGDAAATRAHDGGRRSHARGRRRRRRRGVRRLRRLGPVPGRHGRALRAQPRSPGRPRSSWSVGFSLVVGLVRGWRAHGVVAGRPGVRARVARPGPRAWRRSPARARRAGAGGRSARASRSSAAPGRSPCPCCRRSSAPWSGVVGIVGALTFADGVDDATSQPERFGMYRRAGGVLRLQRRGLRAGRRGHRRHRPPIRRRRGGERQPHGVAEAGSVDVASSRSIRSTPRRRS